ncbi:hypothetical protein [Chitinophaga sp. OAE865]|uniref:hypothetical protein n=1 Tax=Chitinophaga sp. OAE865 TaxID=2817898 RepID=UPI001AEA1EB9
MANYLDIKEKGCSKEQPFLSFAENSKCTGNGDLLEPLFHAADFVLQLYGENNTIIVVM